MVDVPTHISQLTCACEKVGGRDREGRKCAVGELESQFSSLGLDSSSSEGFCRHLRDL